MTTLARSPWNSGRIALGEIEAGFDVEKVRADFPILRQKIGGHPLVYLDSAASSQKPKAVIDAIVQYYEHDNANIHRGVHYLSQRATEHFEAARKSVQNISECSPRQRNCVCAQRHRGHQSGRANLWQGSRRRG